MEKLIEKTEYIFHPKVFRNAPIAISVFWIVSLLFLPLLPIAFLVTLIWLLQAKCTTLTITDSRIMLREGLLSKNTTEMRIVDIRSVNVKQKFTQRLWGTGTLEVSNASTGGIEITIKGILKPQYVADLIRQRQ